MPKKDKPLHVRLNNELYREFKRKATLNNDIRSELVRKWIKEYIDGVLPTKSGKHTLSKIRHKECRFFLR